MPNALLTAEDRLLIDVEQNDVIRLVKWRYVRGVVSDFGQRQFALVDSEY